VRFGVQPIALGDERDVAEQRARGPARLVGYVGGVRLCHRSILIVELDFEAYPASLGSKRVDADLAQRLG
jgi:hypothetical protein